MMILQDLKYQKPFLPGLVLLLANIVIMNDALCYRLQLRRWSNRIPQSSLPLKLMVIMCSLLQLFLSCSYKVILQMICKVVESW